MLRFTVGVVCVCVYYYMSYFTLTENIFVVENFVKRTCGKRATDSALVRISTEAYRKYAVKTGRNGGNRW